MNYELLIMNYRPVNDGHPGGIVIVIMYCRPVNDGHPGGIVKVIKNYRPEGVGDDMLLWGVMLVSVIAD